MNLSNLAGDTLDGCAFIGRFQSRSDDRAIVWSLSKEILRLLILTGLAAIVVSCAGGTSGVIAQTARCARPELQRQVQEQGQRKRLGIQYSRAVQFNLGSQKTVYQEGETINLDLAVLNTSRMPLFIYQPEQPFLTFKVFTEDGKRAEVRSYSSVLAGVAPSSFWYLNRSGVLTASFRIFVNCNSRQLIDFQKTREDLFSPDKLDDDLYHRATVEKDLFETWGDGCLLSPQPLGGLTIVAELSNNYVVWSPCEPFAKTAVGAVSSKPFKVRIEK